LKLAICSPVSLTNFSGAAKLLINTAKQMALRGHDVEIYALPFGPNRNISLSKVRELLGTVPYYETRNIQVDVDIAYINYVPFIWRRMRLKGVKVAGLHTHLLLPRQHLAETVLHPLKAGCEWYIKAISFATFLPIINIDLASFDAVHIPGPNVSLRDPSRAYRIPLWIDMKKIPQAEEKFEKFTVLFSGRKTWEKGWSMFCEVVSNLKQEGYDFSFLCTGDGHGAIHGLGFLNDDELFNVFKRSHIVVYPSIADMWGLVILEAAACGTPVVTTPIDAHLNQNLPVLYAKNTEEFVKSILYTYLLWKESPDNYGTWCKRLHRNAAKYDVDKIFPMFEKMLENVLSQHSRVAGWQEPRVSYHHAHEDLSRLQRSREIKWALKSSNKHLSGLTLDIGCGKGYVVNLLNELGYQAVGLDIERGFVKKMLQRGLNGIVADATELPLESSTFDQVLCFEIIEHMRRPEDILKEVHRVLRDTGFLILTAPIANPLNFMIDLIRGEKTHLSEMSLSALLQVLRKHFHSLHYKPILVLPIPPSLFGRYFWFQTDLLANHIWACGEKS
jgi:glycosyltransferase involved in cell wall biosynthesis/2-polyprenyl-3-methyl-5-hydroxy-6-metoxy-1,4-benzoquinol methylase